MVRKILAGMVLVVLLVNGCNCGKSNNDENISIANTVSNLPKYFDSLVYSSDNLEIRRISKHVYEHTSFFTDRKFWKSAL